MNGWIATKTSNPQGADYRDVKIKGDGKISLLKFSFTPQSNYWRTGFKLFNPNRGVFPLRDQDSLLFHLGSTPDNSQYGLTVYRNGDWLSELNKTREYSKNKLLTIKLAIDHNNFLKVYVNGSLEFKPDWHLEKPNIREKVAIIAWGDEYDYQVTFKKIEAANWKVSRDLQTVKIKINNKAKIVTILEKFFQKIKQGFSPQTFIGAIVITVIAGLILHQILQILKPKNETGSPSLTSLEPSILPITSQASPSPQKNDFGPLNINESNTYVDSNSGIVIGVNWVISRMQADVTLTFPGKNSEEYKGIKSGKVFTYKGIDSKNYQLTIIEIDSDSIKVKINSL